MVKFTSMQFGGQKKRRGQEDKIYIQIMGWNNKVWSILHPCNWEDIIEEEDKFFYIRVMNEMA